jgi:CBS domain-containing protein
MSTQVVSVSPDTPFDDIARTLIGRAVRAVPVLDENGELCGVVSEADLVRTAEHGDPEDPEPTKARWHRRREERPVTAADLMTAPVLSVDPDASVAEAARLMRERGVGWLAVVESDDLPRRRLAGVLGRSDVLSVFLRDDADLRAEILDEVLGRIMLVDPVGIEVQVREGVVTLRGELSVRGDVELAVAFVSRLEGVVAVDNQLTYRNVEQLRDPVNFPHF